MKKLVITALMALVMSACGNKNGQTASMEGLEFDSIAADSVHYLTEDNAGPHCELSISMKFAKGKHAGKINDALLKSGILTPDYFSLSDEKLSIKTATDSFINRYVAEYQRDYGQLYREDKEHAASYDCIYKVATDIESGGDNVVNYIATITTYGGGEHAITQTLVKNFDAKTGNIIGLDSLFVPGYETELKDIIVKKIAEKLKVKDLEELRKKYVFADNNVYISENFLLKDDRISFIYCEDEIAPHSFGEIRADVDKSEIKRLCR